MEDLNYRITKKLAKRVKITFWRTVGSFEPGIVLCDERYNNFYHL